jgi:fructose-bisphosphate aldolase, class II
MSLCTLKEVMDYASKKSCGIGMFNVVTAEYAVAIVEAAEAAKMPVIVGMPERFFQFYSMDMMSKLCVELAKTASVPVVVHLDHGKNFDSVMKVLQRGFTSVMFDGSALEYEQNVKQTAEIVKIAHAMGVSVEGELGYIGKADVVMDKSMMTQPQQAQDFSERTGVDALAVAIGNLHGHYKGKPQLDFERLMEIKEKVACGLVLHGGSGISEADFVKAIKIGVGKINIYTAMSDFTMDFLKDNQPKYSGWLDFSKDMRLGLTDLIREYILLFGCLRNPKQI